MRRLFRPRGLRVRLVLAFVLVAVAGAAAAAWAGAASAGASLVGAAERRHTEDLVHRIEAVAPDLNLPPDQEMLDRVRASIGEHTQVTYQGRSSGELPLITGELRAAARDRLVFQRVDTGEGPRLLIGTPIVTTGLDLRRTPSGIEVYAVRDLSDVAGQVDGLVGTAALTSAVALPLAVLLALVAAGGVLRPVRRVRDTAVALAGGDLSARISTGGADELEDLGETVNRMADSLQEVLTEQRRFVADVSHELRTPLTTLTAVVEVLAESADDRRPMARESAELAVAETERLVALVEDLMEVSRFDAGMARLRTEPVEVPDAIRDCLRARGWLDDVQLDLPEPVSATLDRRRLDVIVANLVGNALCHGEPPVRLTLRADDGELEIEVTDHGPGLSPEALAHVFDRFYKADSARPRSPGSGLGLAISLANARLHGGDLVAGNAGGGGARFVLRLPRHHEEAE
ncbi:HAMP domain-containing sensor histidine kinase [Amycolatopsis sp. YIM 10]|uniref:sensor histidine kinase n=1 Tax=Amycolatopsis sp. YIM 10 TaxID=2653857 RepID=UPI0012901621|nr:HAMP domain-containing sensor histidine kinase [Amycolatopsis sp. YIM 10]QFU92010.1 Sensor histidine kinase MtrB [Amycolatopsis sp. YIM 10]